MLFKNINTDSPVSWQMMFQNPATPVMEGIISLHNYILMYEILVFVVVVWFLSRSLYLFSSTRSKTAMEFSHDPVIEAVWTIAPAFILIAIAVPSFSLLYSMDEVIEPYMTVKVIGHQWYWSYELDVYRTDSVFDYMKIELPKARVTKYSDTHKLYLLHRKMEFKPLMGFWKDFPLFKWQLLYTYEPFGVYVNKILKEFDLVTYRKATLFNLGSAVKKANLFLLKHNSDNFKLPKLLKEFIAIEPKKPIKFLHYFDFLTYERRLKNSLQWVSPTVKFDSFMIPEADLPVGGLRLLEVDNPLVLPVKTHIRLLVTSVDVIHSWAVPSLGVKVDGIPGRLNQTGIYIKRPGVFYGQCSELCGVNHGFMPIVVKAVDFPTFEEWVKSGFTPTQLDEILDSPDWGVRVKNND